MKPFLATLLVVAVALGSSTRAAEKVSTPAPEALARGDYARATNYLKGVTHSMVRSLATKRTMGEPFYGEGAISTKSAVLKKTPYTSGRDVKRRGTSPAELIAAAHTGSFSMKLANDLGKAGSWPRQIDSTATGTMEDIAAGWTMTQIHLDVIASAPKAGQCDFVDAALRAKVNWPISRALNANSSMRAKLNRNS